MRTHGGVVVGCFLTTSSFTEKTETKSSAETEAGGEVEQVRGGRKNVKLQYGVVGSSLLLVY